MKYKIRLRTNMFSADFAVTLPQVQAGKIRGLAVTSLKRSPAIPELPTVNEALGIMPRMSAATLNPSFAKRWQIAV
jgi:tripartite-type tricarboxylate transporter receptor subunit TctC